MSDYTPTTEAVRTDWVEGWNGWLHAGAAFDRWLAQVRAEALWEAADFLRDDMDEPWGTRAANRLDERANQIRRGEVA
ncbi:hypothetical protein [Georgenia thermotolerans]|uniref:hypothetical protein n=1 Tax=Georgenia thermotolerans TaxID=527326 RepID=UPI001265A9E0|nr:hypothetical protein [Georgenia thermotolerans]